jgi:hypothetical protein
MLPRILPPLQQNQRSRKSQSRKWKLSRRQTVSLMWKRLPRRETFPANAQVEAATRAADGGGEEVAVAEGERRRQKPGQ